MSVPGIFKLGRLSILLQIWHLAFKHFFSPVKAGVVEILVLTSICLKLSGSLYAHTVVLLNNCLPAGILMCVYIYIHMYIYIYI